MQPDTPAFTAGEAISYGWKKFQENVGPLLLAAFVVFAINGIFALLQRGTDGLFTSFVIQVIGWVISLVIAMGWIRIALKIVDGQTPEVNDLFIFDEKVVNYAIASILFGIAVAIGFVLLIVPGVIVILVFGFYGYNIVDKGDDVMAAFNRAAELTRGRRMELFILGIALIALNIVGLLVFIVGVLVTSGISIIAVAYVYRRLGGEQITA